MDAMQKYLDTGERLELAVRDYLKTERESAIEFQKILDEMHASIDGALERLRNDREGR